MANYWNMLDKHSPTFCNAAYRSMQRGWKIVKDVAEGTLHLRQLATIYLPKEAAEESKEYSIRLDRAVFFNAFRSEERRVGKECRL